MAPINSPTVLPNSTAPCAPPSRHWPASSPKPNPREAKSTSSALYCSNFPPPPPPSTKPSSPAQDYDHWPTKRKTRSHSSTRSSVPYTPHRGVPPPHNAPKSVIRYTSWSPCATADSSTRSPTSATAMIPPPTPPSVAPSRMSKTRLPHWTRHSEPSATPPTWPPTSADCRTESGSSPPAPKHSPPASAPSPTATSKCCPA